jgi:hypothetical protein
VSAAAVVTAGLAGNDPEALDSSYRSAVRFVIGTLAVLMIESRSVPGAYKACKSLLRAANNEGNWQVASRNVETLGSSTGVEIIRWPGQENLPAKYARAALRALLTSDQGMLLSPVYFETLPPAWISTLYEKLLDLRPRFIPEPPGVTLKSDSTSRKRSGSFFTTAYIIDYIVEESLGRISGSTLPKVLDPSMGPGDFLMRALRFLSKRDRTGIETAENCLFGCDIDSVAVEIARFMIWLETGCKADISAIARHLVHADALAGNGRPHWEDAFPDAFQPSEEPGFDAVIGNPPYVAAKTGTMKDYGPERRGQSDYYLMFLESVIECNLVRPGGGLAMVLPDPFLVRANATYVRKELLEKWKMGSIIHISGVFPSAQVANIVLVCSNQTPGKTVFPVVRLDKAPLRRRFEQNPRQATTRLAQKVDPKFALVQPKSEVLYLVDDGKWKGIFERIHGPEKSLSKTAEPFIFLKNMGVKFIFRGEEMGKRAIMASEGDMPILLGGESIRPYRIVWEGHKINRDAISKTIEWYEKDKIILQKSSARLVAAFDSEGFAVPQSVYGIKLQPDGYHPLYLLAVLNSTFMNDYVFRAFTGYKLVQPQIELEDVKRLPMRSIRFDLDQEERAQLGTEGRKVFESELSGRAGGFPALGKLVGEWIKAGREDVVHDLLVYLSGFAIRSRNGESASTVLAGRIDRAIDTVVDALYF